MTQRAYDSHTINRMIREFTQNPTLNWSKLSADKLEHILRHYDMLGPNEYYSNHNCDTDALIFKSQPSEEMFRSYGIPYVESEEVKPSLGKRIMNFLTGKKDV